MDDALRSYDFKPAAEPTPAEELAKGKELSDSDIVMLSTKEYVSAATDVLQMLQGKGINPPNFYIVLGAATAALAFACAKNEEGAQGSIEMTTLVAKDFYRKFKDKLDQVKKLSQE